MKTKQPGKHRTYFQNLPKVDFGKVMEEVRKRGYIFYRPAKKQAKDESKD